jgi:di/tricarboxylate transporter
MYVVFAIVALSFLLFVTEWLPVDVTALLILVLLAALQPWTTISPQDAISGFSNPATITVLAMLILSEGIRRTGLVQLLGQRLSEFAGKSRNRQLGVTIAMPGAVSGFVNNTPVVALLVPVISEMAHEGRTSPSKLLIPLSYASMLGGTLTLIGTSTNLLASNVSDRLLGHPFGMFEFTSLGVIVLAVGALYLFFVGHRLLPERVKPRQEYIDEYGMKDYLARMVVPEASPLIGQTVDEVLEASELDLDLTYLQRGDEVFRQPLAAKQFASGDELLIRADRDTLEQLMEATGLELEPSEPAQEEDFGTPEAGRATELVEVVIPSGGSMVGQPLSDTHLLEDFNARIMALRRNAEVLHTRLEEIPLQAGDTLLIQAEPESIDAIDRGPDFLIVKTEPREDFRFKKIPMALAIMAGVVVTASVGWTSILLSSLAGVVLMVLSGILKPNELYDSVPWNVIFLLAGIIPLGMALERTGGAGAVGDLVALSGTYLPALIVLWLFYVVTGLITSVISNNASVVLMVPVAIESAAQLGANPFAFVLAVTFAASTAFLSPVGYQTNLFVYGPGGYTFADFFRIGAPLQLLLSVVSTAGIWAIWGL